MINLLYSVFFYKKILALLLSNSQMDLIKYDQKDLFY